MTSDPSRLLILGAAGRDFHNFNVVWRDDPATQVVAFTAAQIPGIAGRRYPPALAGSRYPDGIPILDEADLEAICARERIGAVVFAYSDVTHAQVMHLASRALAAGADFRLVGPDRSMLRAPVPVIAVSAVRTGAGKSQTSRWLSARLRAQGLRVAVLRHPMPYGDLARQAVQRFASAADLAAADCTVEEREEYEPHVAAGNVVFAGVDYAAITAAAAAEADLIVWDGGNNDFPFLRPDIHLVVVDALRPDQVDTHHPGEAVLRMADVVLVNKADAASPAQVAQAIAGARRVNPRADVIRTASPIALDDPAAVAGRRVVVVEDGPTITHGGMAHGAGFAAVAAVPGATIIDPRPWAAPALRAAYDKYPHIGAVLPALGYGAAQLADLRATIEAADVEVVVAATPVDLAALVPLTRPVVRARYAFAELETPGLAVRIDGFVAARFPHIR
ncbi:MAG: GTP-binding protein [Rhodospirillales bacterium]